MATKSEFMVDWTCSLCTMINKAKDYACNICGARKGSSTRRGRGRAQQLDEIVAQQMQGELENLKTDKSDTESSRPDTPVNSKVPAAKPVKSGKTGKNSTTSSPSVNKSPKVKPMKTKTIKTTSKIQKANKIVKTQEKSKRRLPPKHANLDIMSAQSISITANGVTVQFHRFVESIGASNIKISSDVISNNNNIEKQNSEENKIEKTSEKASDKIPDKKKIDKQVSDKNSSKKPESKKELLSEKLAVTKQSEDNTSEITKPGTVKHPEKADQKLHAIKDSKDSNKTEIKKPEMKKPEGRKPEAKQSEEKKPEVKKTEVQKTEAQKPDAKKPETKKKDTKKPEITEKPEVIKTLETTKKPETPKKSELTKKDSKKPSSAKSSATNTPTKKRGIDSDTRLVRTGSGSSNRTASSNERSPRAGSDVKGVKRSRR